MYRQLSELLRLRDEAAATLVRGFLVGLDAALAEAPAPGDPAGLEALRELRRDLEALLHSPPAITARPEPPAPAVTAPAPVQHVEPVAPPPPVPGVAALRRADPLPDVPGEPSGSDGWTDVPSMGERVAVFDPGTGHGLRLRPEAALDPAVRDALRLRDGDLGIDHRIAVAATQLLTLASYDNDLNDYLPTASGYGQARRPHRPADLAALRWELIGRLRAYGQAGDGQEKARCLIAVDEALCSVRHSPPAEDGSWWAAWYDRVRADTVGAAGAAPGVELTVLTGRYEDLRGQSVNDARTSGQDGQVFACLRLWARVEGITYPGRVLVGTD
ncbi:hypothetical protein ACFO3J_18375 [Streptomyces polygonati]|uniref:Uncharacterized protein n=1 Tax=Streptomyces polygonati TaxID=1617087 RepID=A0ABV8HRB1_9ACTN